jgi:hypothetical protein
VHPLVRIGSCSTRQVMTTVILLIGLMIILCFVLYELAMRDWH